MKVLHFFKTYYPDSMGGVEQVIYQLAEGCRAYGVEAEVLYLSPRGSATAEPLAHHLTHRAKLDLHIASTGFSWSSLAAFKRLAAQADVIHYHFPWPFMDLMHFAAHIGKPSVVTYHSDIVKQKQLLRLYQPLMRRFLGSVDRIVATSPQYLASSPVLQQFRQKVSVVPLGLDPAGAPAVQPERLASWRARLPERFFLFVGALRYYKGLHYLLEAVALNGLPVVVLGQGPEEVALKAQAKRLGVSSVIFVGGLPDDDKAALLNLCYALVFPSHLRSEAFGVSLLEAALQRKPMICCEIGTGTSYVNLHEHTGLVVPPQNPEALSAAMQRLWASPQTASQWGEQAHARFFELFTTQAMAAAYASIYHDVSRKGDAR